MQCGPPDLPDERSINSMHVKTHRSAAGSKTGSASLFATIWSSLNLLRVILARLPCIGLYAN